MLDLARIRMRRSGASPSCPACFAAISTTRATAAKATEPIRRGGLAARCSIGEMMNAERRCVGCSAKIGERLKIASRLGILMAVCCRDRRHGIDDDKRDVAYALNLFFQSTHVPRRIKPSRSTVLAGAPHEMHPPKIRTCGYQSRNERVGGIVLARPDDDARLFRPHAIRPHAAGRDNRGELERQRRLSGSRLTTKEVSRPRASHPGQSRSIVCGTMLAAL